MNYFEIGLLVWAIFTTLASVYELFIIIYNDTDSDAIIARNKKIVELSEKLTKTETDNLLLRSQIKELKLQANKQPVKAKVRKRDISFQKKKEVINIMKKEPLLDVFNSSGLLYNPLENCAMNPPYNPLENCAMNSPYNLKQHNKNIEILTLDPLQEQISNL